MSSESDDQKDHIAEIAEDLSKFSGFAGKNDTKIDDIVFDLLNKFAGAAIYAAGICGTMSTGVRQAFRVIGDGRAKEKFQSLIDMTRELAG